MAVLRQAIPQVEEFRGNLSGVDRASAWAFAPSRSGYTAPEFINIHEFGLKQTFTRRSAANLSIFHSPIRFGCR
jgi:hypothetical protein